jgi:hypothetical protein
LVWYPPTDMQVAYATCRTLYKTAVSQYGAAAGRTTGEGGRNERCVAIAVVVTAAVTVTTTRFVVAFQVVNVFRTDALAKTPQALVLNFVPSLEQELLEDAQLQDDVWHMCDEMACPL